MSVDKNSPIPVYYQLKEDIKQKINKGVWKAGECIASERELSIEHNVSRMTVRQALGELVQEGVLYREKGKGTFVCEPKVKQRDIMSFSEMVEKIGLKLKTEILTFEKVHTLENLKNLLPYDEVYKLDRLRIVEGEVIAKELVYIPLQYLEGVERKKLEYSLYNILEEKGIFIDHSEASIQAILIDDNYKKLFRIEKDVPLLKSFSKNITNNGKLIFIEESIYRSDKYILEVNMLRKEGKIK
ncbi:transcriptional regulator, GntR family [Clostridium sp. USBA 49]|jgi:GntR family transcriptional regulator|uniref:GntR family transcriptional regulator n=1 Tax=Clostridium TaxID=1485 RepID=UPI00099B2168|nr:MULTISPECIES: GntR family transcriptional regulator [Clostridium]SKA77939.1 transcriptional regulator, GntR family [Clostridium sp. USBA 49]